MNTLERLSLVFDLLWVWEVRQPHTIVKTVVEKVRIGELILGVAHQRVGLVPLAIVNIVQVGLEEAVVLARSVEVVEPRADCGLLLGEGGVWV